MSHRGPRDERERDDRTVRVGGERVGKWGFSLLVAVALLAGGLAIHGVRTRGLTGLGGLTKNASGGRHGTAANGSPQDSKPAGGGRSSTGSSHVQLGPLLSSTQYAPYAFRLYPGSPNAATQQALAGFQASVSPQGSQIRLKVVVLGSSQPPIANVYPSSDRIYFIEADMGDDPGTSEYNFGDDGLVVTNAQGRIVR